MRDKKAVKARQARLAKKNAQYSRASATGGRNGMLLEAVQESVVRLLSCRDSVEQL